MIGYRYAEFYDPKTKETYLVEIEPKVTVCNDQLPDQGSYQHFGYMTKGMRKQLAIRKNMRKRRGTSP